MRLKTAAAALLLLLLAAPGPALAAPEVALRPKPVSKGASITLADIFAGVVGPAARVPIAAAAPPGGQALLDAAEVQTKVRLAGYEWANAEGVARVAVASLGGGPGARPAAAPAKVGAPKRPATLVYARNIRVGEVIRPEDLRWSAEAVVGPDGLGDPDAAVGKAARRPLREGAPAIDADLAPPLFIHRDDVVSVTFAAEGVSLTLQAKALGDASRGETVEVVNTQSKKVIEAVCSGPGQAAVGPAAAELKASLQAASSYATAAR
jgi:flagella basal body P-ring formation protein FlgA